MQVLRVKIDDEANVLGMLGVVIQVSKVNEASPAFSVCSLSVVKKRQRGPCDIKMLLHALIV